MTTHTVTIANRDGATYEVEARRPLLDTCASRASICLMAANMAAASPARPS